MAEQNKYILTLIENAHNGKLVAMEELYEININQVHTLVSRLAGNKLTAELLTKNILVRAWEKMNEEGPGEKLFSDWLKELSVELTVQELKKPTFLNDKKIKKHLKKERNTANYSSDPTEKYIAELDLDHRITFVLNKIENYNLSKIAIFLGIEESEVEVLLSESIEKISAAMSDSRKELFSSEQWLNLQAVIDPDNDILKNALEEIKQIRTEEVKVEEEETEAQKKEEIAEIEKTIEKERKEKAKAKKEEKEWKGPRQPIKFNKKIVLVFAIPALIFLSIKLTSSTTTWIVNKKSGSPSINNEKISSGADLSNGDIIRTDNLSSAIIGIGNIGDINIYGSSSFKRLDEKYMGELLEGKASISANSPEEELTIKVPEATISNFRHTATYKVEVDNKGNSVIECNRGWLRVKGYDNVSILSSNYRLNVYQGFGASVPIHSQSTFEYSAVVDEYLFGGKRDVTLKNLLNKSSHNDIITLWNFLTRVGVGHQTENVYNKLYELAPHSDHINKVDVLLLEPQILDQWLGEIKTQI
ncbi:MAG: hypothetical protein P8X73_02635 [Ignavibacteriaceae bacterium]